MEAKVERERARRAAPTLTWELEAARMLELYDRVLARPAPAPGTEEA